MSNVILTSTSGGLDAAAIEPFFRSLQLSGYEGDVVVFVTNISPECRSLLEACRAKIVDFEYCGIPTLNTRADRLRHGFGKAWSYYWTHRPGEKQTKHLFFNNARFFSYYDYLQRLPEKPEFVLLADVRDVVFQKDPFSFPFQRGLSVASENTGRSIVHSWCAIKGMLEAIGIFKIGLVLRDHIICAGTTVADYSTMMAYLELLTAAIRKRFRYALLDGIDQGLHTWFVHRRRLDPIHCYTNWSGPFLTMDREIVGPENKNEEGYLCNRGGGIIPIVHQYDRVKGLYRREEPVPPCWKFLVDGLGKAPARAANP